MLFNHSTHAANLTLVIDGLRYFRFIVDSMYTV